MSASCHFLSPECGVPSSFTLLDHTETSSRPCPFASSPDNAEDSSDPARARGERCQHRCSCPQDERRRRGQDGLKHSPNSKSSLPCLNWYSGEHNDAGRKNGGSKKDYRNSKLGKSLDDGEQFSSELHAICLLALFHVNFVCGICNEALIDCICLECGHNFCSLCLQQWLTLNRFCPTCYQLVKEDFGGGQRTYCVDEFIAEMYTSVQELTAEYFGDSTSFEPPILPDLNLTSAEIQSSIRNVRILNRTPEVQRQQLKALRRNYINAKNPVQERNDFSILEQQTELFSGPDNLALSAIVQFFLSSITAYVTYEGGDGIDNDFLLVGIISILVWCTSFLTLMRLLGYDGTFLELLEFLQFIHFIEEGDEGDGGSVMVNHEPELVNPRNGPEHLFTDIDTEESATAVPSIQVRSSAPIRVGHHRALDEDLSPSLSNFLSNDEVESFISGISST